MLRRMADRTDEEHDFDLVDEFIRSPAGILLKRIMPVPGKGKRPDFEVLSPHGRADFGGLAAYMEVKSPRDDRLETLVENSQEGVIAGYAGRDPAMDRIARHIRDAARQFLYVNPDRVIPNILVEVNHADAGNFDDLVEAISGTRPHAEDEDALIWSTQPAKRLKGIADQIDLFLWIDDTRRRRGLVGGLWSDSMPAHRRLLEKVLSGLRR